MADIGDSCRSPERAALILPDPGFAQAVDEVLRSDEIRIGCNSRPNVRPRFKDPSETRQSCRSASHVGGGSDSRQIKYLRRAADNALPTAG